MAENLLPNANISGLVEAQAKTLEELSKRLLKLEQATERQDSKNQNIIIAVLFATFLIVATVAVQVSLSDKSDRARTDNFLEKLYNVEKMQVELKIKQNNLTNDLGSIKTRNPNLK